MHRKWVFVFGVAGCLGGLFAGQAWADTSSFCSPGALQGNPICTVLILLGMAGGMTALGALGAAVGWLVDGRPRMFTNVEPSHGFRPGAATIRGARWGVLITGGVYVLVWLTEGLEGLVILKQDKWAWLLVMPIVLGVGLGYLIDRHRADKP